MPHTDAGEYSTATGREGSPGLGRTRAAPPPWIQCGKGAPRAQGRGFWMHLNANVLGSQAGPMGTVVGKGRGSGPGSPTETRSVASGSRASPSSGSQPCWPTQAQPDALPVQCHWVEGGSVGGEGSLRVSPDPGGPFVQSRQRGHWAGPLPRGWTAASWSLSVEGVDKQLLAWG